MPSPKIKDISVIATAPAGLRLVVVKIITDQDGLYGYGCATFTQRADLVMPAVEKYLKPFLMGKPADRIEDIWQAMYNSSYWRNGPVLNNAHQRRRPGAVGHQGPQADMPVYQLLGGKCREAADCYGHASGGEIQQVIDSAQEVHGAGLPPCPRAGRRAREWPATAPGPGAAQSRAGAARRRRCSSRPPTSAAP